MIEGAAPKLQSWGMSVFAVDMSSETKLAKELGAPKSAPMIFKVGSGGCRTLTGLA